MAAENIKNGHDKDLDQRQPDREISPGGREGMVSDPDFHLPLEKLHAPQGHRVSEVMTRHVEVLRPDNTLEEAAQKMDQFDIGPLPVCERGVVVGMITDRDIIVRSVCHGEDPSRDRVRDVMSTDITCCFEDQDVAEATRLMQEKHVHQLPVLDRRNHLVGIVTLGDLAARDG